MKKKSRPLVFGEVLFDRFPDGTEVLGGAPFNVAWNLHGLGFDPLLISAVGDDDPGRKVLAAMGFWGMDRSGVQVSATHGTGVVNVSLEDNEPRFEIVADCAWDTIDQNRLPALPEIGLVYHGTLALRQEAPRGALEELVRQARAPILVDVNLRAPWWSREQVLSLLQSVEIIKMNEDELCALTPGAETPDAGAQELLEQFRAELLFVTRGDKGAAAYTPEKTQRIPPPERGLSVVDTVGAGDAFAATIITGSLCDWPLATTLTRAQKLAGEVVGLRGAVTKDLDFYRRFQEEWRIA